jgi:short-subunit dehydrogenase
MVDFVFSTAGYTMLSLPGQKVYNSTKTALTYLTEGFRHELVHSGSKIKVTVSESHDLKTRLKIISLQCQSVDLEFK